MKQCVYKGAVFVKKEASSTRIHNLVSEESHFHSAFSYRGFTRIEGVRCKEVGAISLESNSYRQAVH